MRNAMCNGRVYGVRCTYGHYAAVGHVLYKIIYIGILTIRGEVSYSLGALIRWSTPNLG